MATLQSLAEMRRQLLAPAAAALPGLAEQAGALSAALAGWVTRFEGRTDQVSREYRKATQSSVPRPACPPATPCLTSMRCWAAPFAELPGRPSGRSGGVASGHPGVAACRAPHLPAAAAARVVPYRTGGGWGRGRAVGCDPWFLWTGLWDKSWALSSIAVQVYVHRLRSLPLQGPDEPG